ncbi:tRNA1(Val) A37 N6-methylase TrmN6 [Paracoccus halophilus]|uniref:Methyltransferase n=1 Tax=Paracoccus halophilus TaxID=376733 RepID=A0A099F141_9RHOB|nr:methyltransferase [Paracoccus halophilus]KGJ03887.1 methyltransferase [Paracoccus halophilus]SFA56430.1 tRNA1(Val) A37 N6-methylase TrmN6 [Paracoccus halophilus]
MSDLREDGFLGGRLRITQPAGGYRAGADAVMMAAACPARAGQSLLELGCGAGVAMLCVAIRVPGIMLSGLELQPEYAALARRNADANGIAAQIFQGDLARMPATLRDTVFDHVMANPPYFTAGTAAPDAGRSTARHENTPLAVWIDAALRRLRPGGHLTLIQRTERLGMLMSALEGRAGAITILPVAPREGREAGRVIIVARKGARAPLRLLAPFIMHEKPSHSGDGEDLTPAAQAVLRDAAALSRGGADFR